MSIPKQPKSLPLIKKLQRSVAKHAVTYQGQESYVDGDDLYAFLKWLVPGSRICRGALLASLSFLAACAPFPHYDIVVPAITGKVHRNGNPVVDALVYFEYPESADDKCTFQSDLYSRTDRNGRFQFEQKEQFSFFVFAD